MRRTFELHNLAILAGKEIEDAKRNRWFTAFSIAFTIMSLALAWFGMAGPRTYGVEGFGRTAASLINLVILVVSLMGLSLGALSLANEREQGTLLYILSQPVTTTELLLGKFCGLAAALTSSLVFGFGITGIAITILGSGARERQFLYLIILSALLGLASLSLGLLLSAGVKRGSSAIGLAIMAWLVLVFFSDLGLLGASIRLRPPVETLLALAMVNPVQVFRMAGIMVLHGSMEILGPAGVYASRTYGEFMLWILVSILIAWTVFPLIGTYFIFKKRGAL